MKTMTCAQMGGMCEEKVSAETEMDMIAAGMAHLEVAHPEMAESIKSLDKNDPMIISWGEKFHADWEATPEEAA